MGRNNVQDLVYEMVKGLDLKVERVIEKVERIEIQTTKTNGRVTALENSMSTQQKDLSKVEGRVGGVEQHQKGRAYADGQAWRWREYIAKYGVQAGTFLMSAAAFIFAIKGGNP